MGLSNCAGTIPGFMGPLMVGSFTSPQPTIPGWRSCFFISAAIGAAGLVVFASFAAGTLWSKMEKRQTLSHERGSERSE